LPFSEDLDEFREAEANRQRALDHLHAANRVLGILAKTTGGSRRMREQAETFVVAQGVPAETTRNR
jgi:hypothetical protein